MLNLKISRENFHCHCLEERGDARRSHYKITKRYFGILEAIITDILPKHNTNRAVHYASCFEKVSQSHN